MKYMTFNSSCSYAGLANLLSLHGVDTGDREIALGMGLPYLFAFEDGRYLAGPMLQGKRWFDLYLLPNGFTIEEKTVRRDEVGTFLQKSGPAMLGLRVSPKSKHAVIYKGLDGEEYLFLNNKRQQSDEPDTLSLSRDELASRLDETVVTGVLRPVEPENVDQAGLLESSLEVLARMKEDIAAFCRSNQGPEALQEAMDPLFRALLLDGVSMLELLGERALREKLLVLQRQLLSAVREKTALRLDMETLEGAAAEYADLIRAQAGKINSEAV